MSTSTCRPYIRSMPYRYLPASHLYSSSRERQTHYVFFLPVLLLSVCLRVSPLTQDSMGEGKRKRWPQLGSKSSQSHGRGFWHQAALVRLATTPVARLTQPLFSAAQQSMVFTATGRRSPVCMYVFTRTGLEGNSAEQGEGRRRGGEEEGPLGGKTEHTSG